MEYDGDNDDSNGDNEDDNEQNCYRFLIFYLNMTFTDNEAPVLACPGIQTANTEPTQANATVVWSDPQVIDNSGHLPTVTCNVESGSQFEIGETEVICQAVDVGGNRGACSFNVIVTGRF